MRLEESDGDHRRALPDGRFAENVGDYVDAWRRVGASVAALIPGSQCVGFDPDFEIMKPNGTTFCVPAEMARAIHDMRSRHGTQ